MTNPKGGTPTKTIADVSAKGDGSGSVEGPDILSAQVKMNLSKEVFS